MACVYYVAVLLVTLYSSTVYGQLETVNGTINVLIGTTAGCSDARRLAPQLRSTYEKYQKYLNFAFVPWGRTRRDINGNLVCQFGESDCWANRVHRCALHLLEGNPDAQFRYIMCEFTSPFPAFRDRSLLCTQIVGLNVIAVEFCVSSAIGTALEEPAQLISMEPMAVINFVPFIVFNNNINWEVHFQAFRNFENVVCTALKNDNSTGVTDCPVPTLQSDYI